MNAHELKSLQVRKTKLEVELAQLEEDSKSAQRKCSDVRSQLNAIKTKIQSAESEVVLTEHAMLRYFERAMGCDLDELRKSILTDSTKSMIETVINGKVPLGNGFTAVVKNKTIVTIE